jgi:hypothetical protein
MEPSVNCKVHETEKRTIRKVKIVADACMQRRRAKEPHIGGGSSSLGECQRERASYVYVPSKHIQTHSEVDACIFINK